MRSKNGHALNAAILFAFIKKIAWCAEQREKLKPIVYKSKISLSVIAGNNSKYRLIISLPPF